MIKNLLLPLICSVSFSVYSQTISGRVIDSLKREPIAFANLVLSDGMRGTTTDIEGNFKLVLPMGYSQEITISHIGYQKVTIPISYFLATKIIRMKPSNLILNEVVVKAGENPAFRIIRRAIESREKHDPDNLDSYQYISYNKFIVTADEPSKQIDSLTKIFSQKKRDSLTENQQNLVSYDSLLKTAHLFMSESVTQKQVINPNREKETLLASQVSGFKSPLFTNVATDYQPFSFYKDAVTLLGKKHINPITKGTFNRYDFYLVDTTYSNADTVFIIHFQPKPKKIFDGLEGIVSITTDGYAIKNVIAKGADSLALTTIRIQQNYEKISNKWFPTQLNTDLNFSKVKFFSRGLKAQHRSFIKDIQINPSLRKNIFGDIKIELNTPSPEETKKWLQKFRVDTSDAREARTYVLMDSVMKTARKIDAIMEALTTQSIPVGFLDIDLNRVAKINRYEKFRLGIGLSTNHRFSKLVKLSGYYGYGFGDRESKYGGDIRFNFNTNKDLHLKISYMNDLYETGTTHVAREGQPLQSEVYRNWVGELFDRTQSYKIEIGSRILPDVHSSVFASYNQIMPTYEYSLLLNGDQLNRFNIAETGVYIRYIKQESYFILNGKKVFLTQNFPVVTATLAKSVTFFEADNFDYIRLDVSVKHQIKHRTIGKTDLHLLGGSVQGIIPFGRLYNGRGADGTSFYVKGYFQTMGLYEFTTNQYASLFLNHNFGNVLVNKSFSKPELLLFHSMGIGTLQNATAHQKIILQSMDKGYVESGLGLNNLLRIKYFNIAYLGVGASVFYRYGAYQLPNFSDNFAYRVNASFSF
jgi:subtilisin-like proprotein convertase family protein